MTTIRPGTQSMPQARATSASAPRFGSATIAAALPATSGGLLTQLSKFLPGRTGLIITSPFIGLLGLGALYSSPVALAIGGLFSTSGLIGSYLRKG